MYIVYLVASSSYSTKEHKLMDKVQEPSNPETTIALWNRNCIDWNAAFGSTSWFCCTSVAIHEIGEVFKGDILRLMIGICCLQEIKVLHLNSYSKLLYGILPHLKYCYHYLITLVLLLFSVVCVCPFLYLAIT